MREKQMVATIAAAREDRHLGGRSEDRVVLGRGGRWLGPATPALVGATSRGASTYRGVPAPPDDWVGLSRRMSEPRSYPHETQWKSWLGTRTGSRSPSSGCRELTTRAPPAPGVRPRSPAAVPRAAVLWSGASGPRRSDVGGGLLPDRLLRLAHARRLPQPRWCQGAAAGEADHRGAHDPPDPGLVSLDEVPGPQAFGGRGVLRLL